MCLCGLILSSVCSLLARKDIKVLDTFSFGKNKEIHIHILIVLYLGQTCAFIHSKKKKKEVKSHFKMFLTGKYEVWLFWSFSLSFFLFHLACWMPENGSALRLPGRLSTWAPIRSPQTRIGCLCCRAAFCNLLVFFLESGKLIKRCIVWTVCWGSAQLWASANNERIRNPIVCYKASLWDSPAISEGQLKLTLSLALSHFHVMLSTQGRRTDKEKSRAVVIKVTETTW